MGVVQEDRWDAPQPDVQRTEYGAEYVNVATESPIVDDAKAGDVDDAVGDVVAAGTAEEKAAEPELKSDVVSSKPRKKAGRPRKPSK